MSLLVGGIVCRDCGVEMGAENFYYKKSGALRSPGVCKPCWRARYYEPRREEIIKYVGEWKRERYNRPGLRSLSCEHCGQSFDSVYAKSKFCSRACKDRARKDAQIAARVAEKAQALGGRCCVHCGDDLLPTMRADAKFCSEKCNQAAHNVTRKMAKRAGSAREGRVFSRQAVATRDNWRCGICGDAVDPLLKHPDPGFGSIDHVVPLARCGTNDLDNLQLAHLRCNLVKRDSVAA